MAKLLQKFYHSTFGQAFCGAVLLWAALPPLDFWPLAWIAPVWWILLARREQLSGRRPYRTLWAVGFLFWLVTYHFVRLPHPANTIGLLALAAYLGCYLPIFVALVRVAVHRVHVPLILAAPIVWTGLELARAHLLTGITMGAIGHTQYRWLALIQVSDLFGGYVVDFVIVFIAACIARSVPCNGEKRRWSFWPAVPAVVLLAVVLAYGHWRLAGTMPPSSTIRVALIQGSVTPELKSDPERIKQVQQHYVNLTYQALGRWDDLDLIVWPETMCRMPLVLGTSTAPAPERWSGTQQEHEELVTKRQNESEAYFVKMMEAFQTPMLIGVDTTNFTPKGSQQFNSAVLVTPDEGLRERYDKMHRVLFGEYIPLGQYFPQLQRLTPLPFNLDPGAGPVAMDVRGVRLSPNICYETVLPHVIRNQVLALRSVGREPDVLVNLTNDGWFRGSSELDMHLVCSVFRAVECRKPILIAANTGISAWIDADGRLIEKGPRGEPDLLLATIGADQRKSVYLAIGDLAPGICLTACIALALFGLWSRRQRASC